MEQKRYFSWLKDWRVLTLCGSCLFAGFLLGLLIFYKPWHLQPALGDLATWIEALATIGLLAGAVVTVGYARRPLASSPTNSKTSARSTNARPPN